MREAPDDKRHDLEQQTHERIKRHWSLTLDFALLPQKTHLATQLAGTSAVPLWRSLLQIDLTLRDDAVEPNNLALQVSGGIRARINPETP